MPCGWPFAAPNTPSRAAHGPVRRASRRSSTTRRPPLVVLGPVGNRPVVMVRADPHALSEVADRRLSALAVAMQSALGGWLSPMQELSEFLDAHPGTARGDDR